MAPVCLLATACLLATPQHGSAATPAVGVSLAVDPGLASAYSPVNLNVRVSPAGTPGTVTLLDGNIVVGSGHAIDGGFTMVTTAMAEGPHTVTAMFRPDGGDPARSGRSSVAASEFRLGAGTGLPDGGGIRLTIPAGPLFISTFASTPFDRDQPVSLDALSFDHDLTAESREATVGGLSVTDTRAEGALAWTMTIRVTRSASSAGGPGRVTTVTVG